MLELYNKLKNYTIEDAIKIEETDRQFIALRKLYDNMEDKWIYLSLIVANSIICYQLSWKWESYWEEFSEYFSHKKIKKEDLLKELGDFIKQSKNNKRFVETKIKRLEKLKPFLREFGSKQEYFYNNMLEMRDLLATTMKQKKDAKTIVFAIKMFSYGARNYYGFLQISDSISIPIDSRLEKLFSLYAGDHKDIKHFYEDLSKKLSISPLHLDAILWVGYDKLLK